MLLAVNVENSHISLGIFEINGKIVCKFKVSADITKTSDEYCALFCSIISQNNVSVKTINSAIVSSVVPQLSHTVSMSVFKMIEKEPLMIGPGVKTGFPIKIDSPAELGGDIVANTAAVLAELKMQSKNDLASIIVDMNTVTTVSAINSTGDYIGCSICPGVQLSFDSMHGNTAQLPNVSFAAPKRAIGKNSQDSVRSGVIIGTAAMLDGLVYRFAREMKCKVENINLIITGEYASYVIGVCNSNFKYCEELTLNGLYHIYINNNGDSRIL